MLPRLPRPTPAILAFVLVVGGLAAPGHVDAQQTRSYTISGTVVDARSLQPLAGASVQILGTERGALTDSDGTFDITVELAPGSHDLRVRLIGRRDAVRTVELGTERRVDVGQIQMEATAVALDELVVTGTGAPTTRRRVGNTIETVSGEQINESVGATSVDEALQGKVAGAVINSTSGQAGSGTTVRLRGTSTINGNAEPLYVVDGVIIDNSSDAFVSVSANEGRQGASLNTRISDIVTGEIERIEVLKGAAAASLYGSRAASGVIQIFTKDGSQGLDIRINQQFSAAQTPARYDLVDLPRAGPADVIFGPADSIGQPVQRFDYQDDIFRSDVATSTQLSVSGGGAEGTSFYLSGAYRNEPGIVASNNSEVKNGFLKVSRDIGTDFALTGSLRYVQARNEFVREGEQTDGALTNIIFNPNSNDFRFDEELGRYPNSPVLAFNPLQVIDEFDAIEDSRRLIGSVQATWSPVERLSLNYVAGIDDGRQSVRGFTPRGATSPTSTGQVENTVRTSRQFNNDITASYDHPLTDAVSLQSNAGFRWNFEHSDVTVAAAENLPPEQQLVGGATQFASQSQVEQRTLEAWIQETVSVNDRLYLTGGVNFDASSAFGEDERTTLFPRAMASWVVSEEPFFDVGFLSSLRLRGAYGEAGGRGISPFAQFNSFVENAFAGRPGLVGSVLAGNPELGPETEEEIELGFDAGLLDDRANLEFTWYDRTTEDLVLEVPLPPSSGFQSQFRNVGAVQNTGFEVSLRTLNVDTDELTWSTSLQVARNQNEVQRLTTASDTLTGFGFGGNFSNAVIEGHPIGAFFGYFTGDTISPSTGLPVRARDEDGNLLRRVLGDPEPDFTASLQSTLGIGERLSVEFLLDGRFGNDVANLTRRIAETFGTDEVVEREIERAIARKDDPSLQPISYFLNGELLNNFGRYVEDGTFVKLREFSLRYDLGSEVAGMVGARSASVRLAGRNLFTLTDYSGLDPEINMFGSSTIARGVDFANTPVPRTYVVGFDVRF